MIVAGHAVLDMLNNIFTVARQSDSKNLSTLATGIDLEDYYLRLVDVTQELLTAFDRSSWSEVADILEYEMTQVLDSWINLLRKLGAMSDRA